MAQAAAELAASETKARRWRVQQRQLAAYRGAITDEQRVEMNERDAPLEEIPDHAEHQEQIAAEAML